MLNLKENLNKALKSYKNLFSFGENRKIFLNEGERADSTIDRSADITNERANEQINQEYDTFEENYERLQELDNNSDEAVIDVSLHPNYNMYRQLSEAFTAIGLSGYNELAAEFSDALTDNETFTQNFSLQAVDQPGQTFNRLKIENNTLYLIGTRTFAINLDGLRSDRYQELNQEYETDIEAAIYETQEELQGMQTELEGETPTNPEQETETNEAQTDLRYRSLGDMSRNNIENLRQFTYQIELEDGENSHLLIRNEEGTPTGRRLDHNDSVTLSEPLSSETFDHEGRYGGKTFFQIGENEYVNADYLVPNLPDKFTPESSDSSSDTSSDTPRTADDPEARAERTAGLTDRTAQMVDERRTARENGEDLPQGIRAPQTARQTAEESTESDTTAPATEASSQAADQNSPETSSEAPSETTTEATSVSAQETAEVLSTITEAIGTERALVDRNLVGHAIENIEVYNYFELPENMHGQDIADPDRFRSALLSGAIADTDILVRYMDDLGVDLEELTGLLHFTNASNDLESGRNLNADQILANTNSSFRNENFASFLNRLQELNTPGERLNTEEVQELQARSLVFNRINQLIHFLTTMEYTPFENGSEIPRDNALNVSPDYITSADLGPSFRETIGRGFTVQRNPMKITALYIEAFGPLERLIMDGSVSIEAKQNNKFQIVLNEANLTDAQVQTFRELVRDTDFHSGIDSDFASLTQAFQRFRSSDSYQEIRNRMAQKRLESASETSQDQIFAILHGAFDSQYTGQFFTRRERSSASNIDLVGRTESLRGARENETEARMSDYSIIQQITNEVSVNGPEGYVYSPDNFIRVINRYISLGQIRVRSNLDESIDTEAVQNAENLESNFFDNPQPLSEAQVLAIRQGVLHQATERERSQESDLSEAFGEAITEQTEFIYNEILLNNPNLSQEEAVEFTRKAIHLLGVINASDPDNIEAFAGLGFTVYETQNEDGTVNFQVDLGLGIGSSGQVNVGISLTRIQSVTETGRTNWFLNGGVGVNGAAVGFHLGTGISSAMENGTYVAIATGVFNGTPYLGVEGGQSYESRVRASATREAENLDLDISYDQFVSIANGSMQRGEILSFANDIPLITEQLDAFLADDNLVAELEAQGINPREDQDYQNAFKIQAMEAFAQNFLNLSLDNTRGIGWSIGMVAIPYPPFVIPYVGAEFGRRRVMSIGNLESAATTESYSEDQVFSAIASQLAGREDPETLRSSHLEIHTVNHGGMYALDENGQLGYIRTSEPLATLTNAQLNDPEEAVRTFNENSTDFGLNLSRGENPDGSPFYTVNLNDFEDSERTQGMASTAEILIDNHSGIIPPTAEDIADGNINIQFEEGVIPRSFIVTRQEIVDPVGDTSRIIITLSARPVRASEIQEDPFASPAIYVDQNGEYSLREVRGSVERTMVDYDGIQHWDYTSIEQAEVQTSQRINLNYSTEQLNTQSADWERNISALRLMEGNTALSEAQLDEVVAGLFDQDDFREFIAGNSTIETDGDLPNPEAMTESIRGYLESLGIDANDRNVNQVLARLYPGTFLTLEGYDEDRRVAMVERVITEVTPNIIRDAIQEQNLDIDASKVTDTITQLALNSLRNNPELLANLTGETISTETFDANTANYALSVAALRTMGANGLREMIFTPDTAPQIIEGSMNEYDLNQTEQLEVAEFLHALYRRPFETSTIEVGNSNISQNPEFKNILRSPAGLSFLEASLNVNDIQTPIYSLLLNNPDQTAFINTLIEATVNGEPLPEPPVPNQAELIQWLIDTIQAIHTADVTSDSSSLNIPLTDLEGNTMMNIGMETQAGNMLIHPCGNLSFYFNQYIGSLQISPELTETFTSREETREYGYEQNTNTALSQGNFEFTTVDARLSIVPPVDAPPPPPPEDEPGKPGDAIESGTGETPQYQVDANGDFVLDENGKPIIVTVDNSAIGGGNNDIAL